MMRIYDLASVGRDEILNREFAEASSEIEARVAAILDDVATRGDAAVLEYTERFDGAKLESLRVSEEEIDAALAAIDPALADTIEQACANIRRFHEAQVRQGFELNPSEGISLGQRVIPLESAGLYVPGGTARYPSTVLMDAVPAKIAGVEKIVMVTPPDADGSIPAPVLVAAKIAGVTDIYKVGGAQAVAALAFGTESIPRVDKIVGPGNIYVATAKKRVYGRVDIDMVAGPSEILVVADTSAKPVNVAADLLSQAEHDRMATAVLVCDDADFAQDVAAEVERQLALLPRYEIARASIDNCGKIIVAPDLMEGIDIANAIAPEHLELCVEDPRALLPLVKNAGAIFMGYNTPEALGDYWAGPNHTLPTLGTARFSSPLSVDDFVKKSNYIEYSDVALREAAEGIMAFAKSEGLDAHARSIAVRFGLDA